MVLKRVDHVGIVVRDMDESLKKYKNMFHVAPKKIETMEKAGIKIAFIQVGESMVELLQPLTPGKGSIGEFLEKHGDGFHHVAYGVAGLEHILAEMKQAGIKLRDETPRPGGGGSRIAFISPEETNNVLVELVEPGEDTY